MNSHVAFKEGKERTKGRKMGGDAATVVDRIYGIKLNLM